MRKDANGELFLFLSGSLISSIGSMTYLVCAVAFMLKAGFSLQKIGLFVATVRLCPIVVMFFWGDLTDLVSTRKVILISELLAAASCLGVVFSWRSRPAGFLGLLIFGALRNCFIAVQGPGRSKVARIFGGADDGLNSKYIIWINKVTHGSAFFAAGLGWLAVKFFAFEDVLYFDLLTFILNGIIIWHIHADLSESSKDFSQKSGFFFKFKDLYLCAGRWAFLDLMLAVVMCGANLFSTRIAADQAQMIPLFLGSYGLAVWTSGYLARLKAVQSLHVSIWVALGLSYFFLARAAGTGLPALFIYFLSDSMYWLLFHHYSGRIQNASPTFKVASINSARSIQMLLVLAAGEFAVGAWENAISVRWDGGWRAILCLSVASGILFYERPHKSVNKLAN